MPEEITSLQSVHPEHSGKAPGAQCFAQSQWHHDVQVAEAAGISAQISTRTWRIGSGLPDCARRLAPAAGVRSQVQNLLTLYEYIVPP